MAAKKSRPKAANIPDVAAPRILDWDNPANHFPLITLADYDELVRLREGLALPQKADPIQGCYRLIKCAEVTLDAIAAFLNRLPDRIGLSGLHGTVQKDGRELYWSLPYPFTAIYNWQILRIARGGLLDASAVKKCWPLAENPFEAFGQYGSSGLEVISYIGSDIKSVLDTAWACGGYEKQTALDAALIKTWLDDARAKLQEKFPGTGKELSAQIDKLWARLKWEKQLALENASLLADTQHPGLTSVTIDFIDSRITIGKSVFSFPAGGKVKAFLWELMRNKARGVRCDAWQSGVAMLRRKVGKENTRHIYREDAAMYIIQPLVKFTSISEASVIVGRGKPVEPDDTDNGRARVSSTQAALRTRRQRKPQDENDGD